MITLEYTNHRGVSLVIGEDQDLELVDLQGLNPPQATFASSTLSGFDGIRVNQAWVTARNLILVLRLKGDPEVTRQKLYRCFAIKQTGILKFTSHHLQVQIQALVESVECPPMVWPQKVVISLVCPQPFFEALSEVMKDITSITEALSFPLEFRGSGIELGEIHPSEAQNIVNPGDLKVGMTIRFQAVGTVINPRLINTITLEDLELNLTLQSGDVVTITTEPGNKRIELNRSGVITNQFNSLVLGSTFLQLEPGDNVLYATSSVGSSFLLTQVAFKPKYSGV